MKKNTPVELEHLIIQLDEDLHQIAKYLYRRRNEILEGKPIKMNEKEKALAYFQLSQYLERQSFALRMKMVEYVVNAQHPILKAFDPKNYPDLFRATDDNSLPDSIDF